MATYAFGLIVPVLALLNSGTGLAISSVAVFFVASLAFYFLSERPYPGIPLIGKDASERTNFGAKARWISSARSIVFNALEKTKSPFQVISTNGPLIIFPPSYTYEIRSDERLTVAAWVAKDFFPTYPGFEGLRAIPESRVFANSVRIGLGQSNPRPEFAATMTANLADETKLSLQETFPLNYDEWQEANFDTKALRIIARLSSRTFLPESIYHNEEWLRIAVDYTENLFIGAYILRNLPPFARPLHWVIPITRKLRNDVATARRLINPVVIDRKKEAERAVKAGETPKEYTDTIAWVQQASEKSGEPCDAAVCLLNYSVSAVHTTSQTLINIFYNIVASPGSIELIREELIDVLKDADGWNKTTLNKLNMMDSHMKESNRMSPTSFISMNRVAHEKVILSDGTVIPKGAHLCVPNVRTYDPAFYENPHEFNGRRFYDLRKEPGNDSKHQFVTTDDSYIPFGHGKSACPGRFFASNEIKIVLAHLLLQYDFKFPDDQGRPKGLSHGPDCMTDPKARMLFKARTPEVSLDLDNPNRAKSS